MKNPSSRPSPVDVPGSSPPHSQPALFKKVWKMFFLFSTAWDMPVPWRVCIYIYIIYIYICTQSLYINVRTYIHIGKHYIQYIYIHANKYMNEYMFSLVTVLQRPKTSSQISSFLLSLRQPFVAESMTKSPADPNTILATGTRTWADVGFASSQSLRSKLPLNSPYWTEKKEL